MKGHRMCPIIPYCIVICKLFSISELCSPVPQVDDKILALRRALETAEQSSVEGRIVFDLDQARVPLAETAPTCNGLAQPVKLTRARIGQTAVFSCPLHHCSCHNTTCPDLDELIVWEHNDCTVQEGLCKEHPSSFVYSQTRTPTTAHLFIHNVSFDTVGSVYCFCQRKNDTGGRCINQAYELTPLLTPADVFETPVLNVTRPGGTNITLVSKLRIRFAKYKDHRYMARYNRRLIWAQASHPLFALREGNFARGGNLSLNEDNFTMTFPNLPKSYSGQYEVWVRPYMEEDEFVMQTINLKLT